MRKFCLGTTFILSAAAMLAVGAPKAQAALIVDYSLDGGVTFVTLLSGASGSTLIGGSATLGAFALSNLSILSNSPGTASPAKLLSASLDVQNTSGSTASIELVLSDTGFTAPTAPPSILPNSHIGGSVTTGNAANLASFTSCISTTSTNLTSCSGPTDVAGPETPAITQDSFLNNQYEIITSLVAPYSITSIWNVTLGAGSDVGFQANASLSPTNVPEPISMSLLGTAVVGLAAIRRRRA
jgi:hypothetical protein